MGADSKIGWTDHTFNPWWGCERVSPGCQHCYAEAFAKRTGHDVWGRSADRRFLSDSAWAQPVKWNRQAEAEGVRRRVFCASMADVFEDRPELGEHRERLWTLIEATPWLDWLLLTKRPQNVLGMVPAQWLRERWTPSGLPFAPMFADREWSGLWPRNVWVGTTVEDQQRADERIPHLLAVPAPVRFLSCEPLLGGVRLDRYLVEVDECLTCEGSASVPVEGGGKACPDCYDDIAGQGANSSRLIHWVIVGGESGPGHRPMCLDSARALVRECESWGVPVFFKQVSGPRPGAAGPLDLERFKQFPQVTA